MKEKEIIDHIIERSIKHFNYYGFGETVIKLKKDNQFQREAIKRFAKNYGIKIENIDHIDMSVYNASSYDLHDMMHDYPLRVLKTDSFYYVINKIEANE